MMKNNLFTFILLFIAGPSIAAQQTELKSTTLPVHFTHGDYRALMDDNIDKGNANDTELYRLAHDSYSSLQEYDDGDVVTSSHTLYVSLQDNNTGHAVTETTWWQEVQTGGGGATAINDLTDAQKTNDNLLLGQPGFTGTFYNSRNVSLGTGAFITPNTDSSQGYYGNENSAIGYNALHSNTTGYRNVAIGSAALYNDTIGNGNSAFGYDALYNNTTGYRNTGIGIFSLYGNTTGGSNSAMGVSAGSYITDGTTANTTGDYGIFIGGYTKALTDNDQNEIVIGYGATGAGSNSVTLGNDSVNKTMLRGDVYINDTKTNVFTDAEKTVLGNTSGVNTGDELTADEKAAINGANSPSASNVFLTVADGGGSGNVTGPGSSTDNHIFLFNGTSGTAAKQGQCYEDAGKLYCPDFGTTKPDGERYQYVANTNGYTGSDTPVAGWWNYNTATGHFEFYDGTGWSHYWLTSEAGQFAGTTLKATPVANDILLIEDSADSNNKKRITVGSLPGGGSSLYVATPPTYSDEACTPGSYAFDASYIYDCVSSGDWNRIATTDWNNPTSSTYSLTVDMVDGNGTDYFTYNSTNYTTDQTFTGLTADATFTVTPDTGRQASCTGTGLTDNGGGSYTANTDSENVTATCTFSTSGGETVYYGTGSDNYPNTYTMANTDVPGDVVTPTTGGSLTKIGVKVSTATASATAKLGLYRDNAGTWELVQCCELASINDAAWNDCTLSTPYTVANGEAVRVHAIFSLQTDVYYNGTTGGLFTSGSTYAGECTATETGADEYEYAMRITVQ